MEVNRKEVRVIMLPSVNGTNSIIKEANQLKFVPRMMTQSYLSSTNCTSHHLYFVSDEDIKVGDWCYHTNPKYGVFKATKFMSANTESSRRKIIATTDRLIEKIHGHIEYLPKPSQSFVEAYCNKGGINKVLVECDTITTGQCNCMCHNEGSKTRHIKACCNPKITKVLKTNDHNEITIHSIKDSWDREEVENLIRNAMQTKGHTPEYEVREFIDQNF